MTMTKQIVAPPPPTPASFGRRLRTAAAIFASCVTHAVLLILFLLIAPASLVRSQAEMEDSAPLGDLLQADPDDVLPREPFDIINPDMGGLTTPGSPATDSERRFEATVPGPDDPREKIGARDGLDSNPPISTPPPPGLGSGHSGSADLGKGIPGLDRGLPGGGPLGQNPFDYRRSLREGGSGASAELLARLGNTGPAEAAVVRGLQWLVRNQSADGRWLLDGAFKDKGSPNDVAGTGLGLLPFLGAGKTHKPAKNNAYDKTVYRGLRFLMSGQDAKRGDLGGTLYGHGIATIALCEAYGLTQDPMLRLPAQRAVNFIVAAQHERGGWRYSPGQEGDLSVTGWQVMALKSAQMAGLDVPSITLKKAERFLDSLAAANDGYGYTDTNATPTMSAVGLLCRQFLQGWGPQNLRLIKGIQANLKPTPPGAKKDAYYYYYATQAMYHFGGDSWKDWNTQMRDLLVKTQGDKQGSPDFGSWTSAGDTWGKSGGGRLMVTSLNLLTLEVYYRYLPLYFRDMGAKRDPLAG
jgi:hypothetical protein